MEEKRQHSRHDKPLSVSFAFFGGHQEIPGPRTYEGFIEDISLGGVRIKLVDQYGFLYGRELQGMTIKLSIPLPQLHYTLTTTGLIQWVKNDHKSLSQTLILGVEFQNVSVTDKQYLENYLSSNLGDQNLLWDLWNKEVKP